MPKRLKQDLKLFICRGGSVEINLLFFRSSRPVVRTLPLRFPPFLLGSR